jgi:myo-inositol 2-dehydrogenase/D-chiro-inositol 1-dehydrogenase
MADGKGSGGNMTRRGFLATAAAAATVTIVKPSLVRGYDANAKIALGIIGCGGRGKWIANLFNKHGGYEIVSAGDYFTDRVDGFGGRYKVPAERRHTGLANHEKVLADKVDAVAIESPPYFHPMQAAAAVEAGKHVYVAKPIAVDVPGCMTIAESGRKATRKKQVFVIDFQTRAEPIYQEAVKRTHNGDVGRVVNGVACYYCGFMFGNQWKQIAAKPDDAETRLRCWQSDQALSGDIITEQHIHAIDVACWFMDCDPESAVGTGGRKLRKGDGIIYEHFNLVYSFSNGVPVSFTGCQFGKGSNDIGCWIHGSRGTADTHYFGDVKIHGDAPYAGGTMKNLFTQGAVNNIATFHESIGKGKVDNPTVTPSVRSNLTTILGRTAAYTGKQITFKEMLAAKATVPDRVKGLKA